MIKRLLVFSAVLFGFVARAQTPEMPSKGLLYQISGNGLAQPSYIFGTFHLLKDSYLDELPRVKACFRKADGLIVEINFETSDVSRIQAAMLMDDTTLYDLLSAGEEEKLDGLLRKSTGMGLGLFSHMKPGAIMLTVSSGSMDEEYDRLKKYHGDPLDFYFMKEAKEVGKPVVGLETVDDQINVLMGDPVDTQIVHLKKFLKVADVKDTLTGDVVDLYFNEDLGGMYKTTQMYPHYGLTIDKILHQRNNNWMERIPTLIKEKSQFIAVGALHLAGPTGIVYQLRKKGYTVKAIN